MEPTRATSRLSVAMIVRNCDSLLDRSLSSIRGVADEVVVLDTGSTDDTLHVALEAVASVHRQPWTDSFAAARNACLEKVTGDWVLWLDAGETIDAENGAALRQFVQQSANRDRAYLLDVALPAALGHHGREQAARLRLHPRSAGLRFTGRVRERLDLSAIGFEIQRCPVVIHRGPEDHASAVRRAKAQRNIRLADLQLAEQGPAAVVHNCLGESFQSLGDPLRAVQHYRHALELSAAASPDRLEAYYGLLTCFDGQAGQRSGQLALCMTAVEQFPLDAQLLVALGGYLQSLGHLALAARAFDVAFRHGQIEPQIWHLPEIREIAAVCAVRAFQRAGDEAQAQSLLEAACRAHPHSRRLAIQHLEQLIQQGRREEALQTAAGWPDPAKRDALSTAVRGACLAQQSNWPAARDFLEAALEAGCRERFCLRALVIASLQVGQLAAASSALAIWESVDRGNPELAALRQALAAESARSTPLSGSALRLDAGCEKPGLETSAPDHGRTARQGMQP